MSRIRALLLLLAAATMVGSLALSGATFSSASRSALNTFTAKADWVAPTVTLSDPGSPLRGTATITATANDTGSGIATVDLQYRAKGEASWTSICSVAAAQVSCQFDTRSVADGSYDLRAVATDKGDNTASSVVSDRVVDNSTFGVTLGDPGSFLRGQVALTASVSGTVTISAVRFQIKQVDATTWRDVCVDAVAPYSCALDTTAYAPDLYDLRAVATNAVGTTVVSNVLNDVQLDNVAPTVTLADPGTMRGVATLTATAADADAGVKQVVFQRSAAGAGKWTDICTDAADPYSCRFDTTAGQTPDGVYDLRAIVTDYAGNTAVSVRSARTIDNSVFTVSLDDPGEYLTGAVALRANANAGTVGVRDVAIQRRASGSTAWTTICTDATAPYGCTLETKTLADGLYDFQAVMTPNTGAAVTSAAVTGRRVDNSPLRGTDVQATNRAGGTSGRLESGDRLVLAWSESVKPSKLSAGWSGDAAQAVGARLRDGAALNGNGNNDVLDFPNNPALGSISLGGNYVRAGRTVTFPSSMTLAGSALTVVLGTPSGGVRTWSTPGTMTWMPSSAATDLAGNASSTAPVAETGTADKDF